VRQSCSVIWIGLHELGFSLTLAPAALGLYVWLSYRCFTQKEKNRFRSLGPFGRVRQIGSLEYSGERWFRAKVRQWLRTIRVIWPECPAQIALDGRYLIVGHGTPILRAIVELD